MKRVKWRTTSTNVLYWLYNSIRNANILGCAKFDNYDARRLLMNSVSR